MVRCQMKYDSSFVLYNLGFSLLASFFRVASSTSHRVDKAAERDESSSENLALEESMKEKYAAPVHVGLCVKT